MRALRETLGLRASLPRLLWEAWVVALLVTLAALLQVTLADDVHVMRGGPDLVVLLVASVAILRGPVAGAVLGLAGGFLVDGVGLGDLGATSLSLVVVGYVAGVWGERLPARAAARPLFVIGAASVLADLAAIAVAELLNAGTPLGTEIVAAAIPSGALNLLLAIPGYPLVRLLLRRPSGPAAAPAADAFPPPDVSAA